MIAKPIKAILLIEDSRGEARLLREMFNEQGSQIVEFVHVETMKEAEQYLHKQKVDIILLDLGLPDAQGLEAIRRAHSAAPGVPFVVLTGLDDESLAAQALQAGAQDYLIKGQIEKRGILRALRYAIERKRLERLKDEFVSSVSHELRTPLTSISGALGLLMNQTAGTLSEATARLLNIAFKNSQRLVRLVNDILDIEKLESGLVEFNFERVEIRSLIQQAVEANRAFADNHKIRIELDDSGPDCFVRSDSDRIFQVINNLLSNAIKFSSDNSKVFVAIESGGEFVRISVRDQGPGISEEFKPRIFERFSQEDATNSKRKGGTGLGLNIVKQIVDRLGGKVGFADAEGGGTIFHVELPCWKEETDTLISVEQLADQGNFAAKLVPQL